MSASKRRIDESLVHYEVCMKHSLSNFISVKNRYQWRSKSRTHTHTYALWQPIVVIHGFWAFIRGVYYAIYTYETYVCVCGILFCVCALRCFGSLISNMRPVDVIRNEHITEYNYFNWVCLHAPFTVIFIIHVAMYHVWCIHTVESCIVIIILCVLRNRRKKCIE